MIIFKQRVLSSISKREQYKFEWKTILYLVFCFPNIIWKCRKKTLMNKRFRTYQWGKHKMESELDIQYILKSIRKSNTLLSALLTKHQQILCNYQNSSLIYPEVKNNSFFPSYVSFTSSISSDLHILNEASFVPSDSISQNLWANIS